MPLLQVEAAVDVALGARQTVAAVLAREADRAVLPAGDALVLATDGGALAHDPGCVVCRSGGGGDEEPDGCGHAEERAKSDHGVRIVRSLSVLERLAYRRRNSVTQRG